jgi:hypothetical protein
MPAARTETASVALAIGLCSLIGCGGETRVSLFESSDPVAHDSGVDQVVDGGVDQVVDAPPVVRLPLHRYDFRGTGTSAVDSVGGAHGSVRGGAALDGRGRLALDGQDDYVDLPNGLISRLHSATFVVWFEWYDGRICWQRVFDFGNTVQGEDVVGDATSNVFMTPFECPTSLPLAWLGNRPLDGGSTEVWIKSPIPFPVNVERQVALVINGETRVMEFYIDAQSHGEVELRVGLEEIEDVNNWIGRSQWVQDRFFYGRFDEFRIYDVALSALEITQLYSLGPDLL